MTREEFYQKRLEEYGYVCPVNEFDDPDFHIKRFADTCNAAACPYYNSICRIFGGKKKTPSQRRKLVEKLKRGYKIKIWRILYETGLELYVAKEALEEAIAYAKDQDVPFSQVMEISEM